MYLMGDSYDVFWLLFCRHCTVCTVQYVSVVVVLCKSINYLMGDGYDVIWLLFCRLYDVHGMYSMSVFQGWSSVNQSFT
jgi:hypothetical protein